MTVYRGQCNCRATGYEYQCETPTAEWPIRACQCHFCRSHSAQTTSLCDAMIDFTAESPAALQRYRFGLKTADFLLCAHCDSYLGAVIETPAGRFGIVNTRVLESCPTDLQHATAANYDDEDSARRIARRERLWSRVGMVP